MKLFKRMRDGGPESPVIGYFLVEIKSLFSIALLHFGGTRENFHSHAFNAFTIWLKGSVLEITKEDCGWESTRYWEAGDIKTTRRNTMHKVVPNTDAWAISFRGPWAKTWQEFSPKENKFITLTHGRKVIA